MSRNHMETNHGLIRIIHATEKALTEPMLEKFNRSTTPSEMDSSIKVNSMKWSTANKSDYSDEALEV